MRPDVWIIGENVPDVRECQGHPVPTIRDLSLLVSDDYDRFACAQCDGSHRHDWVSCATLAPERGVPIRCHICGARKCDVDECLERRHHRSPHLGRDGVIGMVGA